MMDEDMKKKFPHIELREYMEEDFSILSSNLRSEDRKELEALFDESYEVGLSTSIEESSELWVATYKGTPFFIFGLTEMTEEKEGTTSACIWAVGTERSKRLGKTICVIAEKVLDIWFDRYDCLFNYIWEESITHIGWLKYLGFRIMEEGYMIAPSEEKFYFFCKWSPRYSGQ